MSKTRIRMMEPTLVIGSMLLLIGAITALWRISEAGQKPSSLSTDNPDVATSSFQATAQAVLVTRAAVSLSQVTSPNFSNYRSQDPAKAISDANGQAVARLKTLPAGITDVSVLTPDTTTGQTQSGLTTVGSVRYMGTNGQILVDTVKPASGQSFNLGNQQLTLKSGEKVWYDTNLSGQFPTRFVLQRDNLLILINSNLPADQLKTILEDVTFS